MKVDYPYTRSYRDRHGKLRVEFRKNGRTIALPNTVGTAEFQTAYDTAKALIDGGRQPEARGSHIKAGTLRWLCIEYFKSVEFNSLGAGTQEERRRTLEHCCQEPASPKNTSFLFGQYPTAMIESKHVRVLLARKQHVPHNANNRHKALSGLFNWAATTGHVKDNPMISVKRLKTSTKGHETWTTEDCEQYRQRHPVGTMARLAFDLFYETGQRIGDVWTFGRQHVRNGKLCFTQEKNRELPNPVYMELPITDALRKSLDATKTGDLRFLVSSNGRPFTSKNSLGNWFHKRCKEAGLPEHRSAHGIRKASATYHADNGASGNELCAIFGWKSLRVAEIYVRAANQKKLAETAMNRAAKTRTQIV